MQGGNNGFHKKFKLRGNSPQINKLKTELTKLVNQGGDNSEEILRLEEQIQLLVDLTSVFLMMKGRVSPS